MEILSSEDLTEIKARAEAAAPGPWTWKHWVANEYSINSPAHSHVLPHQEDDGWRIFLITDQADAEFIAHAREDVPRLVVEIERLREQLAYDAAATQT